MTETGTSVINPTGALNRIGSIGQLAPGYTASIRGDDGVARLWSADSRRLLAVIAVGLDAVFAVVLLNALIAIAVLSPCE